MSFAQRWRDIRDRLRASLLGRQHQRVVRAALLLRSVRFAGALSPRSPEFSHRTGGHAHRILRRAGLVSGGIRWNGRRPHGLPPRAVAGLSDPELRLLPVGIAGCALARSGSRLRAAGRAGDFCSGSPGAGNCVGEAQCRRHHRTRLEGKRPLHRILDLLHAGKHRRRGRPLCCVVRAPAHARGERLSRGCSECLPDVPWPCCCFSANRAAPRKFKPPVSRRPAEISGPS